jgi:hypothetical protein
LLDVLSFEKLKGTLPAASGTPPRRGIVEFIPPLRGVRGVCLYFVILRLRFSKP